MLNQKVYDIYIYNIYILHRAITDYEIDKDNPSVAKQVHTKAFKRQIYLGLAFDALFLVIPFDKICVFTFFIGLIQVN